MSDEPPDTLKAEIESLLPRFPLPKEVKDALGELPLEEKWLWWERKCPERVAENLMFAFFSPAELWYHDGTSHEKILELARSDTRFVGWHCHPEDEFDIDIDDT